MGKRESCRSGHWGLDAVNTSIAIWWLQGGSCSITQEQRLLESILLPAWHRIQGGLLRSTVGHRTHTLGVYPQHGYMADTWGNDCSLLQWLAGNHSTNGAPGTWARAAFSLVEKPVPKDSSRTRHKVRNAIVLELCFCLSTEPYAWPSIQFLRYWSSCSTQFVFNQLFCTLVSFIPLLSLVIDFWDFDWCKGLISPVLVSVKWSLQLLFCMSSEFRRLSWAECNNQMYRW